MTAKFSLGSVVATPGAIEAMQESGQAPEFFLDRLHAPRRPIWLSNGSEQLTRDLDCNPAGGQVRV